VKYQLSSFRLVSIVILTLLCGPIAAKSQQIENAQQLGVGVICDTAEQMNHYLRVHSGGLSPEAAIKAVNKERKKPRACGIVAAAFIKGDEIATMVVEGGMMKVFQVTILAAVTRVGWQRVSPQVKYTAIFEKSEEA